MRWVVLTAATPKIKENIEAEAKKGWEKEEYVPWSNIIDYACRVYTHEKGIYSVLEREEAEDTCRKFIGSLLYELEGKPEYIIERRGDKIIITEPKYKKEWELTIHDAIKILEVYLPKAFSAYNVEYIDLHHKAAIEEYPSFLIATESGEIFEASCDCEGKAVLKSLSEIHVKIPETREYVNMDRALDIISSACKDFENNIKKITYTETLTYDEFVRRLIRILEEKVGPF